MSAATTKYTNADSDDIVIGLDIGNTYSPVSVSRNKRFEIINNELGQTATPTMVAYTNNGVLVGQAAKDQQDKLRTLLFKHDPDYSFPETDRVYDNVNLKGKETLLLAEEILAEVVHKPKSDAEIYLKRPVRKAVLSIPALYKHPKRETL
ncbi:hypothetical protein BGX33_002029 [Mortierella sp. NVP41]|nr:hypothetical protein BGX33_002029 [Mortierella sp. NVP41]